MVNQPNVACYAVNGKNVAVTDTYVLMDGTAQIEIELWKYDPEILGEQGTVDPLSLIMILRDIQDERVEEAVQAKILIWY